MLFEHVTVNAEIRTVLEYSPFRYRGYIYDNESGFYYLNSRYYDPQVGRFVNADNPEVITASLSALTDKNLYAYCDNNPVMRTDHGGEFWHIIAGTVVGGALGAMSSIWEQWAIGEEINWATVGVSAAAGALSGALATVGAGPVAGALIQFSGNALISAGENLATQAIEKSVENIDTTEVAVVAFIGGLTGMGNGLNKGTSKHLMTHGTRATRQIAKNGFFSAAKYYFSQTSTLFYEPLIKDTFSEILGIFANNMVIPVR